MAQFRVEFVLDQASGKYLVELHNPDNGELLVRTEALYDSQPSAVMGVVEMFKNAILQFPKPGTRPKVQRAARKPVKKPRKAKKAAKKKKAARKRK